MMSSNPCVNTTTVCSPESALERMALGLAWSALGLGLSALVLASPVSESARKHRSIPGAYQYQCNRN